jgi:hypothetical protein
MAPAERSSITNGIWLCCTCHKLIDDDEAHYPAGLLFEWRRDHESQVAARVGKTGAAARQRYAERHLADLGPLTYRAEQVVIEKPEFWEHLLTLEVLRHKLGPVLQRWRDLDANLYVKIFPRVQQEDMSDWIGDRMNEAASFMDPVEGLINAEFTKAWGLPGVPGSERDIIRVCSLLAEVCEEMLRWEEKVRFTPLPVGFEKVQQLMCGASGRHLEEISKFPAHLEAVFGGETPVLGRHELSLVFTVEDGWSERMRAAMKAAFS